MIRGWLSNLAGSGLGRSRHERSRFVWAEQPLEDPGIPLPEEQIEGWKELVAEETGEKEADVQGRWLFRGRARKRGLRSARLQFPGRTRMDVVDHKKRVYVELSKAYTSVVTTLSLLAVRGVSTRTLRNAKIVLGSADAVGLSVAFSDAFGISLLFGFVWGLATTVALISAGTVAVDLKAHLTRPGNEKALEEVIATVKDENLSAAFRLAMLQTLEDRKGLLLLRVVAGVFAMTCVSVGVLRAAAGEDAVASAVFVVLAVTSIVATAVLSWRNHDPFSDMLDAARSTLAAAERELVESSDDPVIADLAEAMVAVEYDERLAANDRSSHRHLARAARFLIRAKNPEVFGHGRPVSPKAEEPSPAERVSSTTDFAAQPASEKAANGAG